MTSDNPIFRSLEIIESRIAEKLTVENIAREVYFSKYHYNRLFRRIVGESVMEYVTKRKMTLAGKELLETDDTVLDIALRFGYCSHEGFSRSFKAYMGVSPTNYRKHRLASISQKTVKGRIKMTKKTTDEIIRELNDFVVKAKEVAEASRRHKNSNCTDYPLLGSFWNRMADKAEEYADSAKAVLENVSSMAEHPDEITRRFSVIEVIEDIAFMSNLMALHVGLTSSRNTPEIAAEDLPLCDMYRKLARAASMKANKIAGFFNELSSLIFEDMRRSAAEKIQNAVQKGRKLDEAIDGYEYIKREISSVVNEFAEMPIEDISVGYLNGLLFKLRIISFSVETDVLRSGGRHSEMFAGLPVFIERLIEAEDFFQTLVMPEPNPILERTPKKHFEDIAYQGNVMLFYTRGEGQKLGQILSGEQKIAFDEICEKINDFIQYAQNAYDETAYNELAERLYQIYTGLISIADGLNEYGGAIRFIAEEFKTLADRVRNCVNTRKSE